jgi:hypothetical protein
MKMVALRHSNCAGLQRPNTTLDSLDDPERRQQIEQIAMIQYQHRALRTNLFANLAACRRK